MYISRERKALPERLKEAGCPGDYVYSDTQGGRMIVRMPDGEELTPGEAAARYGIPVM
ncbi:hypothetical protein AB0A60_33460 [Streptomyces sp. NPDC046275]|uniref:hypothetical protein n=1 Tax=Streptomyces sp. NPDC046275 TaxID=3157201 RepID=UPI0033F8703F